MTPSLLGEFIASRRKKLSLSQQELGDILHVSPSTVSRWERGIGYPDINTIEPLANALNISIEQLMTAGKSDSSPVRQTISVANTQLNTQKRFYNRNLIILSVVSLLMIILSLLCFFPLPHSIHKNVSGYYYPASFSGTEVSAEINGYLLQYLFKSDELHLKVETHFSNSSEVITWIIDSPYDSSDTWCQVSLPLDNQGNSGSFLFSPSFQKVIVRKGNGFGSTDLYVFTNDKDYDFQKLYLMFHGTFADRLISHWSSSKDTLMSSMGWNNISPFDHNHQHYIITDPIHSSVSETYLSNIFPDSPQFRKLHLFFADSLCDPEQHLLYFEYESTITGTTEQSTLETVSYIDYFVNELSSAFGPPVDVPYDSTLSKSNSLLIQNLIPSENITYIWNISDPETMDEFYTKATLTVTAIEDNNSSQNNSAYTIRIRFERTLLNNWF